MCGRYTLRTPPSWLVAQFGLKELSELRPRYNISPTQDVPIVRLAASDAIDSAREWVMVRWGLIPPWAEDPSIGQRMINARGETVDSRPAFRKAFREHRCLIPADGFYEWKVEKGGKQPYHVYLPGDEPFAFAGIWERWTRQGPPIESCAIITTRACDSLRSLHDRMPVLMPARLYDVWLDPETPVDALREMLEPYAEGPLELRRANRSVNSPRHDAPDCLVVA